MKWKLLIVTLFFVKLIAEREQTHHVITFFVKDLDKPKFEFSQNKFNGIYKKIVKQNTKTDIPKSIYALYHGYIALSDELGQITFPRQTNRTIFHILVTDKIEPIFMFPNTISHWNVALDTAAKFYSIERKDDQTKVYWKVESAKAPADRNIPLDTIIVLAKAKNILIPEGEFETTDSAQLVLPDIYIKKKYNDVSNALFALQINKFFGPVTYSSEKKETGGSKIHKR